MATRSIEIPFRTNDDVFCNVLQSSFVVVVVAVGAYVMLGYGNIFGLSNLFSWLFVFFFSCCSIAETVD